jgi:large conductance mechanosensitive channel
VLREFKDFINSGNVVVFAVGVVMALFFQDIIDALLQGVVMPVIAAIVGEPDFEDIGFDLGESFVSIGLVINAVIIFLAVAFILFMVVKAYNRVARSGDAPPTDIELLIEIRDELRRR